MTGTGKGPNKGRGTGLPMGEAARAAYLRHLRGLSNSALELEVHAKRLRQAVQEAHNTPSAQFDGNGGEMHISSAYRAVMKDLGAVYTLQQCGCRTPRNPGAKR